MNNHTDHSLKAENTIKQYVRIVFLGATQSWKARSYSRKIPEEHVRFRKEWILERLVACAHECGVTEAIVVRGLMGGKIHCPSVVYIDDFDGQNMVHSLFKARQFLAGEVILSYTNILYEPNVLRSLLDSRSFVSVVVDMEWEKYFRTRTKDPRSIAGSLVLDGDKLISIGQPLQINEWPDGQYIGLLKVNSQGVSIFQETYDELARGFSGRPWRNALTFEMACMTDFLQELIDRGVEVRAIPIRGGWIAFNTRKDYERIRAREKDGTLDNYIRLSELPQNTSVLSSGGVVVKRGIDGWEVLLVGDGSQKGWRLPKGMQEPGESIDETAVREVREETGIQARMESYIGRIDWSYEYESRMCDERAHFYLMRPMSGSIIEHDNEFSEVAWIQIERAISCLRFENERAILLEVIPLF